MLLSLDEEAGACRYSTSSRVVTAIVFGALGLFEMVMHEAQHRLPLLSSATSGAESLWLRRISRLFSPLHGAVANRNE